MLYGKAATSARDMADRLRPAEHEYASTDAQRAAASGGAGREPNVEHDETHEVRERFNPTPFVIALMAALVIFALVLAVNSLREAGSSFTPQDTTTAPDPASEAPPTETTAPPAVTEQPAAPAVVPQIASVQSLDPSTGGGENPDLAPRAIDGDPSTTWNSLRYNNPTYGMKPGLGFAVVLAEPATVTTVTIDVLGSGGLVQIRSTDPSTPDQGDVLAEGPMGHSVTYTLSAPTQTQTLVLWFPQLPVADSDGRNRIELAEITVG